MIRVRAILWLVGCGLLAACSDDDNSFECAIDSDCVQGGELGRCLTSTESDSQFCAYPDGVCESGERWGVLAGDELARTCVEESVVDGGLDAPIDGGDASDGPTTDLDASIDAAGSIDAAPGPIDASLPDAASPPDAFTCVPGTFETCLAGGILQRCNPAGTGFTEQACGAPGCNQAAKRCNECVPSATSCSGSVLNSCNSQGLELPDEACKHSCVPGAGAVKAHCAYLAPKYLPNICDSKATAAELVISASATFDTSVAANCNGGVVTQVDVPDICVVRYKKFRIDASRTWTVVGSRVLAVVTDDDLEIKGTLDVGAKKNVSGPGGGTQSSGEVGGGAGFAQVGGYGIAGDQDGGQILNPIPLSVLRGGPRSGESTGNTNGNGNEGGGGGAANLVSCRGQIIMGGVLRAGGGGGAGGTHIGQPPITALILPRGGGAGGFVVLQGLGASVTGQVFANGGGGGAGESTSGPGGSGADGNTTTTAPAAGGASPGDAARNGGAGGVKGIAPQGKSGGGAGGGSHGYFQVLVPVGVLPVLTPTSASPAFSPTGQVSTK